MQKIVSGIAALGLTLSVLAVPFTSVIAAAPEWDTTGNYVITFEFEGSPFSHDMSLTQTGGNLTGTGGYPSGGPHTYEWALTSGTVSGDTIDFTADYTMGADAVTPLTTLHVVGTIAVDGTMSGTWSDNYQGGSRSGTWTTTSGLATSSSLAAEDFGVVDYDTGLGQLRGYTAGFGLTGAQLADIDSVVVQLYNGATLLQTNTGTAQIATLAGSQFSSPFDVSGDFDYVTDGYWTNVRESQYGQSVPATRVVATVTLTDGQVLTAENTALTGDPTTIYPPTATDADLSVTKSVSDSTPDVAQSITYTITVMNHGPATATNVVVTDVLPAELTFVSSVPSQGSYDSGTGLWTVGTLSDEASATLTITATVDAGTEGDTVTNTASADGTEADLVSANNSDSESVTVNGDVTPPADAPTAKDECKNGGWMTFTNPSFKNQGECVAYVEHL